MCAQDAWGRTALHWAAAYACEASVVLLLVRGAHAAPLSHGTEAQPPLAPGDMAAAAGHIGLAAFLAEHALVQLMKDHNVSLEDPMATCEFLTHLWTLLHHNILGSAAEAEMLPIQICVPCHYRSPKLRQKKTRREFDLDVNNTGVAGPDECRLSDFLLQGVLARPCHCARGHAAYGVLTAPQSFRSYEKPWLRLPHSRASPILKVRLSCHKYSVVPSCH